MDFFLGEGYGLLLTGGMEDRPVLEKLKSNWPNAQIENSAGLFNLRQTAEALQKCSCAISVDTEIMHLAAALGCPLIALHGPTSPKRWGAIGKNVRAVTPPFVTTPAFI